MNKYGFIVGITAATALAGCLDPDWQAKHDKNTATARPVATADSGAVASSPAASGAAPVQVEPVSSAAPVHVVEIPGESDLTPITIEDAKPSQPVVVAGQGAVPGSFAENNQGDLTSKFQVESGAATAAAATTTTYVIQSGDSISKISKRFNIKVDAIKAANPGLTDVNKIRVGQRIQLPGTVDVGAAALPAAGTAAATENRPPLPHPYTPYTGATTDYVVQKGDYLGKIAKKTGCTVRQLKELNGMSTDTIVAGRTLKVPAKAGGAISASEKPVVTAKKVEEKPVADAATEEKPVAAAESEEKVSVESEPEAPAQSAGYDVYEVQDGDDITSISINFDVAPGEIRQLNNLEDGAALAPGTKLKLPAGTVQ